jgi:hypothetical protein
MLAVRTGEKSCTVSTSMLSSIPVAAAHAMIRAARPAPAVMYQTSPQPAKSTRLRTPSTTSRALVSGVNARATRPPTSPPPPSSWRPVSVASSTTAA